MKTALSSDSPMHADDPTCAPHALGRADLAALAILTGSLIALFWKALFTSAMFFYRDVFKYSYPHARFIHEVCWQGHLPYWNPYLNYGEPVLANPNFLFFYPSTLLLILLPVDFAYKLHYLAHFVLAGAGAYLLARRWAQSRPAAFLAGFVFAFGGPVLSLGNFYNHVAAAAWIPWALLLTDRVLESRSRRPWILLTLVFTFQFLAAEPFTLMATFGLSLAYALFRAGSIRRPLAAANLRIVAGFVLVGGLMLALSAVQLLPSLDLLSHSHRGTEGLPFNETTSWSFHPLLLLEFVIPAFFGSALEAPSLWTLVLNCQNMPYFPSLFVGFVPLLLALAGWALGRDRRRNFAAVSALALLVLSFGRFTSVFALAYLLVPPLALVRFPVKLLIPALLFVALLAGWGFDALRQGRSDLHGRRSRILLPLKCLLGCVVLVWIASWVAPKWLGTSAAWILLRTNEMYAPNPARALTAAQVGGPVEFFIRALELYLPGLAGFALGGLLWVLALERGKTWARRAVPAVALLGLAQMAAVNYSANPTVPKSFYTYRPPVLQHFQAAAQPYRFAYVFRQAESPSATPDVQGFLNFESIPEAAGLSPLAQIAFRDRLVLARGAMLEKVEGVSNIDVEGSFPPFLYDYWMFMIRGLADPARAACLMGRTNVKYQVFAQPQAISLIREVAPIFNGSSAPNYLYENLCATPRAYVAGSASYSRSAGETLTKLSDPAFDAEGEIILAREPDATPPLAGSGVAGRVEIISREPNAVLLRADLSRPGYAVLLDRFDPNWHATLDGREVLILRANQVFRAVYAPEGQHEIRFYYRQRWLKVGLFISLATILLLTALYVFVPQLRQEDRDASG
jgi:hypothetical protein